MYLDFFVEARLYIFPAPAVCQDSTLLTLFRCPADSIAFVTAEVGATPESEHVADVEDAKTEEVQKL